MGIRYRHAYRQPYPPDTKMAERRRSAIFTPSSGAVKGLISAFDPLVKPVQYLLLNPSHPALAELYPLRERPCRLKSGDMLRGVENKLLELTLRQYPHRGTSSLEEHRDAPWVEPTVDVKF